MRVLVACEYSGRVRDAFIAAGHEATSCDLLDTEQPGPHYQGDVFDIIGDGWDLMVGHPPCTYLTCSAEWAYRDVQTKNLSPDKLYGAERRAAREEAAEFFTKLAEAPIHRIAIENPVGVMSTRWRKPDQFIQPHEYGHDASKRTGLWLKGLPELTPTHKVHPRWVCCKNVIEAAEVCLTCCGERLALPRWANQTDSGQNREPPSKDRWKIRSTTWQGWADAMADQWGNL